MAIVVINLSKLSVRVFAGADDESHRDPAHTMIEVSADGVADAVDASARNPRAWPGDEAAWTALRRSVGQLARLGLWASHWMPGEQLEHGCRPAIRPSTELTSAPTLAGFCHVDASDSILRLDDGWRLGPWISITVPNANKPEWMSRIKVWLTEIGTEDHSPAPTGDAPRTPTDLNAFRRRSA